MEYTVDKLAKLSGVSTRTLRYYDQIGLLKPARISSGGYRFYGQSEVNMLQQILFYRQLGVSLDGIKEIVSAPNFDRQTALESHLITLQKQKEQIEMLIENVSKTICSLKGDTVMSDKEKFEGFKQKLIDENEEKYGSEIREKYGAETVFESNAKFKGMTKDMWTESEKLSIDINDTLKAAMKERNPAGELAQKACELHKKWLCMFWKNGAYSKEAHRNMGEMYVSDERFKAYYEDNICKGAAEFLKEALIVYTK